VYCISFIFMFRFKNLNRLVIEPTCWPLPNLLPCKMNLLALMYHQVKFIVVKAKSRPDWIVLEYDF
jgi:hypothetical protein